MRANIKLFFMSCLLVILLTSCYTTNQSIVSRNADVSKYKMAAIHEIMDYTGSPSLMDLDVKLSDIISQAGIEIIGEREVENLNSDQLNTVLLIKYSASQTDVESVVRITFIDYKTLRPIATCRGAFGMGWTRDHDMRIALKNALKQVEQVFNNEI